MAILTGMTPARAADIATNRQRRRGQPRWKTVAASLLFLACAADAPSARAQAVAEAGSLEHQVKAAFLYKFAGFVDWPVAAFARPDTPVTIAVLGAEPLAEELAQAVSGRRIHDRQVAVKRLKAGESLAGVHVLFVGKTEGARLNQLAQTAQPRSILTVSESDGGLAQGSVINFVTADRRVRFDVSLDSAEKSNLKLSSRLLSVARQVHTGTP